jgi:hypothetical protein
MRQILILCMLLSLPINQVNADTSMLALSAATTVANSDSTVNLQVEQNPTITGHMKNILF